MDRVSNDDNDNLSPRARFAVRVSVRTRRDIICYYFMLIVSIFGTWVVLRCFSVSV